MVVLSASVIGGLLLIVVVSALMTGIVVAHARRQRWLAIPNARSSHTVPTPSSGGIGIAVIMLSIFGVLGWSGALEASMMWALVGGGAAVALVGLLDDRWQLRARVRIAVHALAAAWALWWIGGLDHLSVGSHGIALGTFGTVLAFLTIVGFSNLYNFMDGIDGLMGTEAVIAGAALGGLALLAGQPGVAMACWVLAAAALGFLVWNWHPAKIFMGDVGSVLFGFSFATIVIALEQQRALPGLLALIIFAVVIVDAGFTTIRRALHGERWYEAHRTFSYQRAVQVGHRHSTVVLGVAVMNVVLVAIAYTAWARPTLLLPAVAVALLFVASVWARYQFWPA